MVSGGPKEACVRWGWVHSGATWRIRLTVNVLSYALHLSREVSGLPIRHREACRPQSFTRRPTIFFNNELRDAAAMDKMWRARLFPRWPCRLECSTGRHACCFLTLCFLGSDWRLTFLALLLMFVHYCLLLMTLVMHLCSACNRRTINFYDDDDDDAWRCGLFAKLLWPFVPTWLHTAQLPTHITNSYLSRLWGEV